MKLYTVCKAHRHGVYRTTVVMDEKGVKIRRKIRQNSLNKVDLKCPGNIYNHFEMKLE